MHSVKANVIFYLNVLYLARNSLTGETEEGIGISEICKLDPSFVKVSNC